jgi:hypothetical protein
VGKAGCSYRVQTVAFVGAETEVSGGERDGRPTSSAVQPAKHRGRPPKDTYRVVLADVDPHGPVQAFLDRSAVEHESLLLPKPSAQNGTRSVRRC